MINIDKVEDGLPISVVVPLTPKRREFYDRYVLPMLEINEPNEIITVEMHSSAPDKRNKGFKKVTQPFVFFCDDDIVLPSGYLRTLYNAFTDDVSYCYTGYKGIVMKPETHPMRGNFSIPSRAFNANILRQYNYISTMALVRTEHHPTFDEELLRFQDWDVYLTMLERGQVGKYVHSIDFLAFYNDEGITNTDNTIQQHALNKIIKKHNL